MPRTPLTTKKTSCTFAILPAQMQQITALAEEYGTSQSRIIRELLKLGLKEVDKGYLFSNTKEYD